MITRQLIHKSEIRPILEEDRHYAAYALGDLEDGFFEHCRWYIAEESASFRSLALVYAGFDPPVLFLMGTGQGTEALLNGPVEIDRATMNGLAEHLDAIRLHYRCDAIRRTWRMKLKPRDLQEPAETRPSGICRRLTGADMNRLRALYTFGGGDVFSPAQVIQGTFYGFDMGGQLIAVAGTHIISVAQSVAAVGNVMTHPDYRGRGYATLATYAVCQELVQRAIETIVLNVREDNIPAIRIYEKLGFVRHCLFYECDIQRSPTHTHFEVQESS